MSDDELEIARSRYNAAFDAYRNVTSSNARLALGGGRPNAGQLAEEKRAQEALEAARREYLARLAVSTTGE
jgi:hypothetical protein